MFGRADQSGDPAGCTVIRSRFCAVLLADLRSVPRWLPQASIGGRSAGEQVVSALGPPPDPAQHATRQ